MDMDMDMGLSCGFIRPGDERRGERGGVGM
jgi:hypothetical protein